MQALLPEEHTLEELDHARSSRPIDPASPGASAPATRLDEPQRMRGRGQSLRRFVNRLLPQRGRGRNGDDFSALHDDELRGLLDRLRRNERDLRHRLADRIDALGGADAPVSDPLYQRHFFGLQSVEAHRAAVEGELLRRDVVG